jgi:hypothetical protein
MSQSEDRVRPEVHMALVHYPVRNKPGEIVATAVTNLDIHDNARSARTYELASYHIVTPLSAQIDLVRRILGHWTEGYGGKRVPTRLDAMALVRISRTLEETIEAVRGGRDVKPYIVGTGARRRNSPVVPYAELRQRLYRESVPTLLLFGTGYGLAEPIFDLCDAVLEPIGDPDGWNHLSVRSAVAITLDRLLGQRPMT